MSRRKKRSGPALPSNLQPGTWARVRRPDYRNNPSYEHRQLYRGKHTWLVVGIDEDSSRWNPHATLKRTFWGEPFLPDDDMSGRVLIEASLPTKWLEPVSPLEMLAAEAAHDVATD